MENFKRVSKNDTATVVCKKCNGILELKKVYKVQECPCGAGILLDAKMTGIDVLKLHYSHFNQLDTDKYEFFFEFDYEHQDEILDFLSENNTGDHIISFIVESQDNVFNLDLGKLSMIYYAYDMQDLVLPKEQFDKIKDVVANEIINHNLGGISYNHNPEEVSYNHNLEEVSYMNRVRQNDVDILIEKINLLSEEDTKELLKSIPLKLLIAEANRQLNINE